MSDLLHKARPPVPLGTVVKPWGTAEAIASLHGERYYFLIDKHKVVSMMPADVVEAER